MVFVFFIYGLAFFSLGLALLVYPKGGSRFGFARDLRLIAAFGLLHGINEWLDMSLIIGGGEALKSLKLFLLPASFLPLLVFGAGNSATAGKWPSLRYALPVFLCLLWAAMTFSSADVFLAGDVWARYLLAAPGIFLTSLSLFRQIEEEPGTLQVAPHLRLSAIGFMLYGAASGLIVPEAGFYPASAINYKAFTGLMGFPIQVIRAALAVVISYGMVRVLGVFDMEVKDSLRTAKDGLESMVGERTLELMKTNEALKNEIDVRAKAEGELRASERKLRDITSALGEGVYVWDSKGLCSFMNPEAERLFGWKEEEVLGKDLHGLAHSVRPDGSHRSHGDCPSLNVILTGKGMHVEDDYFQHRDGTVFPVAYVSMPLMDGEKVVGAVTVFRDITARKAAEEEKARLIAELQEALASVRKLSGLLPICAWCKKIRNDGGYWMQVETFIKEHSEADFTHGICPECLKKISPEAYDELQKEELENGKGPKEGEGPKE